ncbi:MAG: ABC transporter ATP-binding protein [Pseudorhodoplanes sp.]
MPLVEIAGLSITLGAANGNKVHAVRRLDLAIERGTIHGLIGESGCGKTITGMALLGLLPRGFKVAAERFRFDGMDLSEAAPRLRGQRIAMISQDPAAALNPVLSIGRQIDDVLRRRGMPRGERRAQAMELLAATGLPDPALVLRSYPHQLSGGMQQRVVIAQALATGADFLIGDEPTTALDVTIGAQVLALLRDLVTKRGLTVLLISHDMDVVAACCDSATMLYAGESVEAGPVGELLSLPRHPYTRALLAALPDTAPKGQRLAAIEGHIPPSYEVIAACPFAPRCPSVMDVCRVDAPEPHVSGGRSWSCHLAGVDG